MNNVIDFSGEKYLKQLAKSLTGIRLDNKITLMEVCGTHTMAIHRSGIPDLLPENLKLLSGPGCPVCVTPASYLDSSVAMAKEHGVTLMTFGDLLRVPGSDTTLAELRSEGYPVEIVYGPQNALEYAVGNPSEEVVFLAVGFETTIPTVAAIVRQAKEQNVQNFSVFCSHKFVVPALKLLADDPELSIEGFILPGHVSIVLGCEPYRFMAENYGRACVVTGFEPADIIQGILMLLDQIKQHEYKIEIQYKRAVRFKGNLRARQMIDTVFSQADAEWRGFGFIPESGAQLREEYRTFDAATRFPVDVASSPEPEGCICGEILKGYSSPDNCILFGSACVPGHPVGPCMVSSEGTCAAHFQFSR
ncbi:hydrogenase formation protein HypD [candidate division KSB1 bacterium]